MGETSTATVRWTGDSTALASGEYLVTQEMFNDVVSFNSRDYMVAEVEKAVLEQILRRMPDDEDAQFVAGTPDRFVVGDRAIRLRDR